MKKRVAIVDDSPIVIEAVRFRLEAAGYHVLAYPEVLGLLQSVERDRPALMIVDLEMPVMSGDRIIRLIRNGFGRRAPAMLIHSSAVDIEIRSRICRADGFVRKGDDAELITKVGQMLTAAGLS